MFMQDITRLSASVIAPAISDGIIAGTLVETTSGWQAIEALRIGDSVQTHDGGLRPIRAMDRRWIEPADDASLIFLPGGAMDNCADLLLHPAQYLLIDLMPADAIPDAIHALIPAQGLIGHHGCHRIQPRQPIEILNPVFDEEEAIWAASGVRLYCAGIAEENDYFTRLTTRETRTLLAGRSQTDLAA